MNKQATIVVDGSAGPGVAENMMSGTVVVKGDASQYAGATGRGGLLVIEGNASSRCGISMKGIDIVVQGLDRPHVGFHGAVGKSASCLATRATRSAIPSTRRGSSCAGRSKSLGADCIEKEMRAEHEKLVGALLERAGLNECETAGVPPLRLGAKALQLQHRQRRCVLKQR